MQLVDTHCHLDDEQFDDIRDEVVQRAQGANVTTIVAIGTTAASSQKCIEIATRYELVHAAVGLQPNYCGEAKPGDWDEIVQLFKNLCPNRESLNFLTLKQYRGTEWTDRACYQALVLLQKKIESIFDIREMHGNAHVKIHQYPTMPIGETLGLKVKATDSKGTSIVDFLEPIRPFFMRVSLRDELGKKVCSRVNSREWASESNDSDHHLLRGLDDEQRSLLDMVSEPKAVVEYLLSHKYGAHDPSYFEYDIDEPYFMKGHFGMRQNQVVFNVNKRADDDAPQ